MEKTMEQALHIEDQAPTPRLSDAFAAVRERGGLSDDVHHATQAFVKAAEKLLPLNISFAQKATKEGRGLMRQAERTPEHFAAMRLYEEAKGDLENRDPELAKKMIDLFLAEERKMINQAQGRIAAASARVKAAMGRSA